jgi:hypothetical protein
VAKGKSVTALSDDETSRLCDWELQTEGGAGSVTKCTDGTERETHTKDRCVETYGALRKMTLPCSITVGDIEACSLETQKDSCAEVKATCDRINDCVEKARDGG